MGNIISQFFFIPGPPLTETNCPDQTGRVFLVTGGYTGVGFELCKILYAHNATIWIAGRDVYKAQRALSSIKEALPKSKGHLEFLHLDLSDLSTVKTGADSFIAQQQRLDVLVNNAGVMYPPGGSIDAQGNELQMGTNCLGHYLLYQLLLPLLTKTASSSPTASVRVLWAASIAVHVDCPQPHGIIIDSDGRPKDQGVTQNYGQTKVGNVFFAREFARSTPQTGVVHAAFNPGNLQTELQRHWTGVASWVTVSGIEASLRKEYEGGTGVAAKFVDWCGKQTEKFV
ncbi:short-chain alcohol dehydrogenase [Cytospora paraplurivora]|uniref:Short-chain alcohol dehydrogenase n=1 Tax=Cytospora paraplurivora TaxID=2898453 RepID=A0AAN9U8G1_9PEZI